MGGNVGKWPDPLYRPEIIVGPSGIQPYSKLDELQAFTFQLKQVKQRQKETPNEKCDYRELLQYFNKTTDIGQPDPITTMFHPRPYRFFCTTNEREELSRLYLEVHEHIGMVKKRHCHKPHFFCGVKMFPRCTCYEQLEVLDDVQWYIARDMCHKSAVFLFAASLFDPLAYP